MPLLVAPDVEENVIPTLTPPVGTEFLTEIVLPAEYSALLEAGLLLLSQYAYAIGILTWGAFTTKCVYEILLSIYR